MNYCVAEGCDGRNKITSYTAGYTSDSRCCQHIHCWSEAAYRRRFGLMLAHTTAPLYILLASYI